MNPANPWHKGRAGRWLFHGLLVALLFTASLCSYVYWRISRFDGLIRQVSEEYGLDFYLVKALIHEESWYDPAVEGKRGEVGLMQVTRPVQDDFVAGPGKKLPQRPDLYLPADNLSVGCWYLRLSLDRYKDFSEPLPLALARYNAGESRVKVWLRAAQAQLPGSEELSEAGFLNAIDIPSTRDYVSRVLKRYRNRSLLPF